MADHAHNHAAGGVRIAELMQQMAGGAGAAPMLALQREFAGPLRAAVRRAASQRGVTLALAEVDEIVADVVLMLHDVAGAWRPDGGALPWVWAERRIANIVDRHVGLFADELDDARMARVEQRAVRDGNGPSAAPAVEPPSSAVLGRLAGSDRRARVLLAALAEVASDRDTELWLEMRVEESLGDRSPAATVAPQLGMSPEAARQQRRRVDLRLRQLLESDGRFAELAEVTGLAELAVA